MAVRRLRTCIVIISCAIFPCLLAKPFSLNEAIAAEEAALASANKSRAAVILNEDSEHKKELLTDKTFSHNKGVTLPPLKYKPIKTRKFKKATELWKPKNTISPLKYRKLFQINIPLKPKPSRLHKQSLLKKKYQLLKRETSKNDKLNEKHIPLLRNIGLLFGNLFRNDGSEANESEEINNRPCDDISGDKDDILCAYTDKSESQSWKEATADSSAPCAEVNADWEAQAEASTTSTHHTAPRYFSRLRRNPNIPLLLARNTTRSQRNNHGLGARSSPALHRSVKGNITRDNGDSKYNTGSKADQAHTKIHKEHTNSTARNSTSSDGPDRGSGGDRTGTGSADDRFGIQHTNETTKTEDAAGETGADFIGFEVEDQLSFERNETEHPKFIRGRERGVVPGYQIGNSRESVQPQEDYAQSVINVTKHLTSDKRFAQRNGPSTTEDKELRSTDEAVISRNISEALYHDRKKRKVVMIIDGYSVTRSKFGENKLTEKAIQIS